MTRAEKLDRLEGKSITRQLFAIALPIMAANLLQSLYNLADTYFLGSLGAEAVSAPSITSNISSFLIVFGMGFSLAGTTMIGQIYGRTKEKGPIIDKLASQVFIINVSLSIAIAIIGVAITKPLCHLMGVPEGITFDYTSEYMALTFIGMPFMFIDQILRSTMQGLGDTVTPLIIQTITVGLNFILDPIFIFVFDLEVAGAAYATNIARFISAFVSVIILFSGKKGVKVSLKDMRPDKAILSRIFKIGFPSAVGQAISNLGFAVIQGVTNSFGPAVIAAFGIGNKITNFFTMPAMGISQGVQVLASRKLGAGNEKEASKVVTTALIAIGIFITIGMVLCMVEGEFVMRFFVDDDEVIFYGQQFFNVITFSVIVFGLYTVLTGAFNAGGKTKYTMWANILRLWGVIVPFGYILPIFFGTYGLWFSMFASNVIAFLFIIVPFVKGKWKNRLDIPA